MFLFRAYVVKQVVFFSFDIVGTKILFLCKQRTYGDKFKLARTYNKDVYG